ncbi:hypothetical protein MVES_001665 [Malassezia vespertilionis]|uniref:Uncharacterized protein n=1 Tax=Malassezia vespertilionis TaxID=2020962 RepID=A0A2N1JCI5_9BASI|nr:hypothetical protein MVES_001665 [Malassezia vespertilionis]
MEARLRTAFPSMHHVSYHGEDVPVHIILERLSQGLDGVCTLTVSFTDLYDTGCRRFLEGLDEFAGWRWLDQRWIGPDEKEASLIDMRERMPLLRGIRFLDLSSNQITTFDKSGLRAAVAYNGTLLVLELQGNELCSGTSSPACFEEIRQFGAAVGCSVLRTLNLTANQLGGAGLAAFFDGLPRTGTTLKTLYISVNVFDAPDTASNTGLDAARSIARFLRDPNACRGLERLHLNGNHFGWAGVRTIVHAVVGSHMACTLGEELSSCASTHIQPPNHSLLYLDLFSTGIDTLHSVSTVDEEDWEQHSMLTPSKWTDVLAHQLLENELARDACRQSALSVLAGARIVGCRATDTGGTGFPMLRLPMELRAVVLSHLDHTHTLNRAQYTNVLRYASAPSTIGYGLRQV